MAPGTRYNVHSTKCKVLRAMVQPFSHAMVDVHTYSVTLYGHHRRVPFVDVEYI